MYSQKTLIKRTTTKGYINNSSAGAMPKNSNKGFTLPEIMAAVAIIGILSSIAVPNYVGQVCRSKSSEAITSIGSLKAIIATYIDETGVNPSTWDDLNSISAIMSNDGEMSGELSKKWVLPNENYEITISAPSNSIYNISAEPKDGCENRTIRACLNVSTGASKLNKGDGSTNAANAVCT